jgi:hypothetical protein
MFIIGLDLSINYASYCISKDFKEFWFGSIINDPSLSLKKRDELITLTDFIDNFNVVFTNRACNKNANKSKNYTDTERLKLINHIEVSSKLINEINSITNYDTNVVVGLEGMSYGSKGSAAFDVPQITGVIRRDILFDILNSDVNRMFIFTPSELKNCIGCKGNAGKEFIFDAFVSNPMIDDIKDDTFYEYIIKNKDDKFIKNITPKGIKIESPFNDIIDSYLSILKIYSIIK